VNLDRDDVRARVGKSHASTQTDSLTVTLDLSELTPSVARAVEQVLKLSAVPGGAAIPAQDPDQFTHECRAAFDNLAESNEGDAVEFATLMSTFVHECRHVHDLRSTRMGAEMLLHDMRVYSGVGVLLSRLRDWQSAHPDRAVPLPLSGELDIFTDEFADIPEQVRAALRTRDQVWEWWHTKSATPILPGFSLQDLFEFVAFTTQVDWFATTFGTDAAEIVFMTLLDDPKVATAYNRPGVVIDSWAERHKPRYELSQNDVSTLFWSALNANGVDVTVDNGCATSQHAGTWFCEFALQLVDPANRTPLAEGRYAMWACETVFARRGVDGRPVERYQSANHAVVALQEQTYRELARWSSTPPFPSQEAILLATEVGIDYRGMNDMILRNPRYHIPKTYVDLLVSGELITIHVHLIGPDGARGDFRTPSYIPSNHIGSALHASEASQQMRLLTEGVGDMRPFARDVHANLLAAQPTGAGLRVRNGLPAPARRLGPR
jgi:hypothetical protein